MLKPIRILAAIALAGAAAVPASASTVVNGSCVSVSSGCMFSGNINGVNDAGNKNSYLSAQNAYNIYNDSRPAAGPDIQLNFITSSDDKNFADFGSITGAGKTSGTWSLPGWNVDYIAVKASDSFILYQVSAGNFDWSTAGLTNKKGKLHDLSHITFFGSQVAAVPEPGTWAMMIGGFGMVGGAMRSKRRKTAATYA